MKRIFTAMILACLANVVMMGQNAASWRQAMESYNYTQAIEMLDRQIDSLTNLFPSIQDSTLLTAHTNTLKYLYLQKASCQKNLYKFSDAIESITEAIAIYGEDAAAFNSLADCHRLSGNDNAAIIFYSLATQVDPQNIFFKIQKANQQYKMEDFSGCINEGRAIIAKDSIPAILGLIGNSFNKLQQSDSALHYYSKVYPKNPADYRTLEKISSIFLSRKMYDTVVTMAQNYLVYDSLNVVINPIMGLALHGQRNYDESYKVFEKSLEMGCDKLSGYYYLGLNKFFTQEYHIAYKWFKKAAQIDSSDVNLVYYMGVCFDQMGGWPEDVEQYYTKAEQMLQPDSTMIHKINASRGALYFKYEQMPKAIKYYLAAKKYAPLAPAQVVKLAYAYRLSKDYKNALKYYEEYFKVGKEGTANWKFAQDEIAFIKEEEFMNQAE